ncbi:ABC transporter substrate-binding protein [Enterococcus asini ATCC 700915]|uniref:ABC transporter substrate-binding protein n=1 Tax=Enterococcus asini ATCC 700915 TaxID=1158606 RepID=R2S5Z1_9ENTE|nr:tryptophan ABC transporter substrate-binding protein [Enterococcus asini]EOH88321.1 ABC transporter substrate-binding protein [Enterococcus asini ATCC 700915]EOT56118.1 ABC transporter substrate-binding protein [Enterococcus asini ATCC 700915]
MKNKGLMITVAVLVIGLVGYGIFQGTRSENAATNDSGAKKETYRVGVLQLVSHPALDQIYEGIKEGLADEGLEEGKNLKLLFQNGQGDQSKLNTMSQQLLQDKADVLVGVATPAAQALDNNVKKKDIPIVLGAITDPKGAGLVASNDKPGANITGVSDQPPVGEIIQLAKKLLPNARKVGMLYSSSEMNSQFQVAEATKKAESLGLEVVNKPVATTNEVAQTVQVLAQEVDFVFIPLDNTIANAMETVSQEATKQKLPVFPSVETMVEQGGVATVGISQKELGVQTGKMAAKIAKGESDPATTPIYTFSKGETIVNRAQAELFGINVDQLDSDDTRFVGE